MELADVVGGYVVGHIDTLEQLRVVLKVFESCGVRIARNNHRSMDDIDQYGAYAGLFDVNMGSAPANGGQRIEFRCVARPETAKKAISVSEFLRRFGVAGRLRQRRHRRFGGRL